VVREREGETFAMLCLQKLSDEKEKQLVKIKKY
jgi:hypothetical protein